MTTARVHTPTPQTPQHMLYEMDTIHLAMFGPGKRFLSKAQTVEKASTNYLSLLLGKELRPVRLKAPGLVNPIANSMDYDSGGVVLGKRPVIYLNYRLSEERIRSTVAHLRFQAEYRRMNPAVYDKNPFTLDAFFGIKVGAHLFEEAFLARYVTGGKEERAKEIVWQLFHTGKVPKLLKPVEDAILKTTHVSSEVLFKDMLSKEVSKVAMNEIAICVALHVFKQHNFDIKATMNYLMYTDPEKVFSDTISRMRAEALTGLLR